MSSGSFLEVGKTLAYFMHPLGRIYTARLQSPTSDFSVLLKWHRADFLTWMRKQAEKKKCLNSDIVGSKPGIENANLCCRRPGFMKDSLLSPDPHKASVKIRDCFICCTQSQRNVLKCSPVTPRLATIKEQKITIIWTTNATQQD